MGDSPAHSSDAILSAARASLNDQRAGGRRVTGKPIGQRSAALHRAVQKRKAAKILFAGAGGIFALVLAMILVSGVASMLAMIGVGTTLVVAILSVIMMMALSSKDRLEIPTLEMLRSANPKALVGQTQLWLEAQRPALPAPALGLVGQIGGQLDGLALQLDRVDENAPAVGQVRQLVGQHLPDLVKAYTAIPANLRGESHAGASPDQQLTQGLSRLSDELDSVTRQLAEGKLDNLAIQSRFIDYKYGDTPEG